MINDKNNNKNNNNPIETLACTASAGSMKEHLIDLKNKLELVLGEIQLNIENFNATRIESRNEYYIKKYVNDVFKYRIINLDF